MDPILRPFKLSYVTTANLLPLMAHYGNPHNLIARLVKQKELIRLKRGFFLIQENIQTFPIPYPQIGNLLYGPSYVSFEWTLSFYGLIPEGVYMVTSVTTKPSRNFSTPIGTFDYVHLPHSRYAIGMTVKESIGGKFLIATPEKALADLVCRKSRNLSRKELLIDLVEGRRIEEESLKNLDKQLMQKIAERYHSAPVHQLVNVLGLL